MGVLEVDAQWAGHLERLAVWGVCWQDFAAMAPWASISRQGSLAPDHLAGTQGSTVQQETMAHHLVWPQGSTVQQVTVPH